MHEICDLKLLRHYNDVMVMSLCNIVISFGSGIGIELTLKINQSVVLCTFGIDDIIMSLRNIVVSFGRGVQLSLEINQSVVLCTFGIDDIIMSLRNIVVSFGRGVQLSLEINQSSSHCDCKGITNFFLTVNIFCHGKYYIKLFAVVGKNRKTTEINSIIKYFSFIGSKTWYTTINQILLACNWAKCLSHSSLYITCLVCQM